MYTNQMPSRHCMYCLGKIRLDGGNPVVTVQDENNMRTETKGVKTYKSPKQHCGRNVLIMRTLFVMKFKANTAAMQRGTNGFWTKKKCNKMYFWIRQTPIHTFNFFQKKNCSSGETSPIPTRRHGDANRKIANHDTKCMKLKNRELKQGLVCIYIYKKKGT